MRRKPGRVFGEGAGSERTRLLRRGGRRAVPTLALLSTALLACTADDGELRTGWDGAVDTLADGRTVVQNGGTPLWPGDGGWRLREELRVGGAGGEGPDAFGRVEAVEVDTAGRVYVLESQAGEIRVFGPGGEYLRTVGRPGEGPGELQRPAGMAWGPEGALWVMDSGNGRYTAFDPESGDVLDQRRRPFGYFALPWPGGFDRDGRLHDIGLARVEGTPGVASLVRLDSAFFPADTLRLPELGEESTILFTRSDGTPVMSMPDPYTPRPVWALWSGGGMVGGQGEEYRLHYVGFGEDTVRTVALERPRSPVTDAERDSVLAVFREVEGDFAGDASPDRRPRVPRLKPAVRSLLEDDGGHLWVRPYGARGDRPAYDVFDPAGRYLGTVELPVEPGFVRPAVRGDRMVVVTRDELDVPEVVALRIEER